MKGAAWRVRPAAAALLGVALAGCGVAPGFTRSEVPGTDRYVATPVDLGPGQGAAAQRLAPGADLDRDWWRLFRSNALDEVVRRALQHNRTLVVAAANLAQAQEVAAAQAGTRAPQVAVTAGAGRQKYGAQFLGPTAHVPPFNYFSVGTTVSYALDYTGGAARAVEERYALAEFRRRQLDAAYLAVTGNTVLQALKIAAVQAQLAAVEDILSRDRENLRLVEEAFAAGSVSRLDIVSAQSQLAGDTTLLAPLRRELATARDALALLVGATPADASLPDFDLSRLSLPQMLPVSVPSELAHRRPDVLAAEAQLHAATAAVGVATADLYPRIDLTASFGSQSTELHRLFSPASEVGSLAAGLVGPLLDGGTRRAQRRAAIDALRASAANYEQAVLAAFAQVADSLQALQYDAELLDAEGRAQGAALDNAELTRKSYHEGNVGVVEVLDAERRYQQARLGYLRAEAQRYADTVELFLALGGAGPSA